MSTDQYTGRVAVDASGTDDLSAVAPDAQVLRLDGVADQPDAYLALPAVLVAQLLGLSTSLLRGHTPDNPFPTGEVNRVVQGVVVHPLGS